LGPACVPGAGSPPESPSTCRFRTLVCCLLAVALYLENPSPKLLWIFAFLALPTPYFLLDVSPGVRGNIDLERFWDLSTSLFYRSFKLIPVLVLWLWLLRRTRGS